VLELRGDAAAAVGEGVEFGEGVFGFVGGEGETGAEVAERGGEGWGWRGERGDESGGFGWAVGGELEFSGPETGACGGIRGGICEEGGEGGDGEVRVACGGANALFPAVPDPRLPAGCLLLPAGHASTFALGAPGDGVALSIERVAATARAVPAETVN